MPRSLSLLISVAALLIASRVAAQTPSGAACGEATMAWVARCNDTQQAAIARVECPAPGLFLFSMPDARVEVQRGATRSFRQVNGWGLSLVNEDALWSSLPAAKRVAFERVQACVTDDVSLPVTGASPEALRALRGTPPTRPPPRQPTLFHPPMEGAPREGRRRPPPPDRAFPSPHHTERNERDARGTRWVFPWRVVLAAVLLVVARWPRRPRRSHRVRALTALPKRAAAVAAAAFTVLAFRWLLYGPGFFHQNGQGPMWIDTALGAWSSYGPGFAELFNLPARAVPSAPDLAVFAAQGLLAGFSLVAGWALARRAMPATPGASWLAAALITVLLVHPAVGRATVSESYLATGLSLDLLAAWALSHGHLPRGDTRTKLCVLAPTVAGGFLLSLSVAVHPVGWVPAATVPLSILATPGALRRRAQRLAMAYAVVGAVVLVTAGPGVLEVLRGELGQRWVHRPPINLPALQEALLAVGVLALVSFAWARHLSRALVCVLPLFLLATLGPATDAISASGAREYISSAFLWMHAPAAVALVAAALGAVSRRVLHTRILAVLMLCAGVTWSAWHFRAQTFHPTDDLEQRAFLLWRKHIPPGATVTWLARAENHILALPLYPSVDPLARRTLPLLASEDTPSVIAGERSYWYRASSCSTAEGRDFCARIERGLSLEAVVTAEYPGRWSLAHVPFDRARVPVGLYRVNGTARNPVAPPGGPEAR